MRDLSSIFLKISLAALALVGTAAAQTPPENETEEPAPAVKAALARDAARATVTDFKKKNEGFQAGFDYFLSTKTPRADGHGGYSYTAAEIKEARENGERLAPIYEEKVKELTAKVKEDMKFKELSPRFQENFNSALKIAYFDPVVTNGDDGKPRLNVQIADGLLRRAIYEATLATADSPDELADAEERLAEARKELAEAEAKLREKRKKGDAAACKKLREQRDRHFSLGDEDRDPASFDIRANIVDFK